MDPEKAITGRLPTPLSGIEHKLWGFAPLGYHALNLSASLRKHGSSLAPAFAPEGSRGLFRSGTICRASAACGIGRLGDSEEGPAIGFFLSHGGFDVASIRRGTASAPLCCRALAFCGRDALQVHRGHASCGAFDPAVVAPWEALCGRICCGHSPFSSWGLPSRLGTCRFMRAEIFLLTTRLPSGCL